MAKLPSLEEMARNIAEKALEIEYNGKTIREWVHIIAETDLEAIKDKKPAPRKERLTVKEWRNLDPWETCQNDRYCQHDCKGCIVPKLYVRLAEYEDREEEKGVKE